MRSGRGIVNNCGIAAAVVVAMLGGACDGRDAPADARTESAAEADGSAPVVFSEADLEAFERGLRREIEAVKAAQVNAASAATAQERGEAIQAQWSTATIPAGAEASGLSPDRYGEIREAVDRVFTTLDFQGKIEGPMSIDLERADAATKARVSGDAFAGLPAQSAAALRARMDRLVPIWIEYTNMVAVAG